MVAGLFCVGLGNAPGATYYIDAQHGSDDADGKAAAPAGASGPWKTLLKVNAPTFAPGDKILLATGLSWAGQLHPLGSGAAGNPIVVDVYGPASKPLITANGAVDAAVRLFNQSYWEIKHLEVTKTPPPHPATCAGSASRTATPGC